MLNMDGFGFVYPARLYKNTTKHYRLRRRRLKYRLQSYEKTFALFRKKQADRELLLNWIKDIESKETSPRIHRLLSDFRLEIES